MANEDAIAQITNEDVIAQIICRGDTVTLLNPAAATAAADGNHSGVVLQKWKGKSGPTMVLVRRVDGSKVNVNASDVRAVDRSYMQPNMVVASSTDRVGGQLGLVMCAATEMDLARWPSLADGNGDDENGAPVVVARAVSPAEVRRAGGEFCVGDYVVSTAGAGAEACAWLGYVVEVYLDVDVVFDDGAKCRVAWVLG